MAPAADVAVSQGHGCLRASFHSAVRTARPLSGRLDVFVGVEDPYVLWTHAPCLTSTVRVFPPVRGLSVRFHEVFVQEKLLILMKSNCVGYF